MMSLRAFVSDRLTAAAEEIFEAVEKTIGEYKEEIFRLKDLEISRLKMELKLLKSESGSDTCLEAPLLKHTQEHHPPSPPSPPGDLQHHHHSSPTGSISEPQSYEDPGDSSSMDQEQPEPSQIKREQDKIPKHFWMHHDAEDIDDLEPDFISSPSGLKTSLHDQTLHYHPFLDGSIGEESKDNKPYCCSVCEKRFSNCSHLAAHIRTHTGERPYKCEICNKTFITTSALNRHQTIHTEGKRFLCTNCGKSFKWMESLGRHIRSVHKNDIIPE